MYLKQIKLNNFKIHKNFEYNFSDKNIIMSENGFGKTSLLEAIAYVLFGKSPFNLSELVNIDADFMSVELYFNHSNIGYYLIRSYNGSSNILLTNDDGLFIESIKEADLFIQDLLGITYKDFITSIYLKQGEITKLLDITPHERKILIISYINLDAIKTYQGKVKSKIKNIKKVLNEQDLLNKEINNLKSLYKPIISLKNTIKENTSSLNDKINQLETYNRVLEEIDKYNSYQINKTRLNQLEDDYADYNDLRIKKERYDYLKELFNYERVNTLLKEKEILDNESYNQKKHIIKYNRLNIDYRREQSVLCSDLDKYNKVKENLEEEYKNIKNNLKELEHHIKHYNKELKLIEDLRGKCPTCLQDINEEFKKDKIKEYKKHIKNNNALYEEYNQTCVQKQKVIDYTNKRIKELKDKKHILELDEKEFNTIVNIIRFDLDNIIKAKGEEIIKELHGNTLDQYYSLYEEFNNINKKHYKNLDKIHRFDIEEYNLLKKNMENISEPVIDKDYKNLTFKDKEELEKSINDLKLDIIQYKNKLELYEEHNKDIEIKIGKIEIKDDQKIIKELEIYNDLNEFLKEDNIQELILKKFKPVLLDNIKNYLQLFEIDYKKIEINKDYNIIINNMNSHLNSGGERTILSIIYKLALIATLGHDLSLLILDEPTHNLDTNNIENIAKLIQKIDLKQYIIVTHNKKLKELLTKHAL